MLKPENEGRGWAIYNADCVEVMAAMPDEVIDLTVTSEPFGSLYIYSDSERDMGNANSLDDFLEHHRYYAEQLYRTMKPGAIVCDHVKDTVFYQNSSATNESGITPFSDLALASYRAAGFVLRARVTVWRDPVLERSKTNNERLLYKNIHENARVCAPGLPEYILVLRKQAEGIHVGEAVPHAVEKWGKAEYDAIAGRLADDHAERMLRAGLIDGRLSPEGLARLGELCRIPLDRWQEWASPVWPNTRETDVLNARFKGDRDERHICPMPLDLIERCLMLWSNPADVVFDPFTGIGSTGVQSVKHGRKFIGSELKSEYAAQAARFLKEAEASRGDLFAMAGGA